MSNLRDLLNRANGHKSETNLFDDLEEHIQSVDTEFSPIQNVTIDSKVTKDGNELKPGDPVVGIHRNQEMSGHVVSVEGNNVTVEWRDNSVTSVPISSLKLTDVDADYEEETMYLEAKQNMGFDKESFNEDADLQDLLRGEGEPRTLLNYDVNGDL